MRPYGQDAQPAGEGTRGPAIVFVYTGACQSLTEFVSDRDTSVLVQLRVSAQISASDPDPAHGQACERWRRQGISLDLSLQQYICKMESREGNSNSHLRARTSGAAAAGIDSADDAGGRPEPFAPVPRHPRDRSGPV